MWKVFFKILWEANQRPIWYNFHTLNQWLYLKLHLYYRKFYDIDPS